MKHGIKLHTEQVSNYLTRDNVSIYPSDPFLLLRLRKVFRSLILDQFIPFHSYHELLKKKTVERLSRRPIDGGGGDV